VTQTSRSQSGSDGAPGQPRSPLGKLVLGLLFVAGILGALVWQRRHGAVSIPGERARAPAAGETTAPLGQPEPPAPPAARLLPPAAAPDPREQDEAAPSSWPAAWRAQLDRIRRSGPMAPEPAARGAAIFAAWARPREGVEAVEDGGCHAAGCFMTFTFADARAADRFHDHVLTAGDPSSSWRGPRQQLEPLSLPGGKTKVTWLLLPEPPPR
jgi:hypothetical protein